MQVAGDNDIILHNTLTGFQSADLPTLLPSHHLTTAQHAHCEDDCHQTATCWGRTISSLFVIQAVQVRMRPDKNKKQCCKLAPAVSSNVA